MTPEEFYGTISKMAEQLKEMLRQAMDKFTLAIEYKDDIVAVDVGRPVEVREIRQAFDFPYMMFTRYGKRYIAIAVGKRKERKCKARRRRLQAKRAARREEG